eukprot:TRINITY_DN5005_c0_g2_i1.p1 TRINITY_DN5005_c0_g2~~TRINITY_DN5005_c0_g2_i1.p1  ORF type:complete len:1825 (+),score=590.46 TRINITY_DN5005_c0_g2_i1:71-5545(+)
MSKSVLSPEFASPYGSPGIRSFRSKSSVPTGNGRCWFNRPFSMQDLVLAHRHRTCGTMQLRSNYTYNMFEAPIYLVPATSRVRVFFVKLVDHPWFDNCVLMIIFLNVAVEILGIPSLQGYQWSKNISSKTDWVFLSLFTAEASCKIMSLGFVLHKWSYLRDPWNVGDFMIVLFGWSSIFFSNNLTIIRLVRLMRPLRAIRRIRGLRVLVNTIVLALPMMVDVLCLLLLVMYVFAVLGIQMWKGRLHQRCYADFGTFQRLVQNDTDICGARKCQPVRGYNITCTVNTEKAYETVFNYDYISFAMLTVFKVVTLDDWPTSMNNVQDADSAYVSIYFVALTLIGGYFCLNLVLAILAVVYTETQKAKLSAIVETVMPQGDIPTALSHAEKDIIKKKVEGWRRHVDEINRKEGKASTKARQSRRDTKKMLLRAFGPQQDNYFIEKQRIEREERRDEDRDEHDHFKFVPLQITCGSFAGLVLLQTVGAVSNHFSLLPPEDDSESESSFPEEEEEEGEEEQEEAFDDGFESVASTATVQQKRRKFWFIRKPFRIIAQNKYFNYLMLCITIANVVMMACDHQGASEGLLAAINNTNLIASWCFLYEMIFKMIGLGLRKYFRDGYNIMDCVLVLMALPEMLNLLDNLSSFTAFRAFRGFRLMVRIKPLQPTVTGIVKSLKAVLWLLMLMGLLIVIYSMLGLNLFQYSYGPDERENFRSLWEAAVTTFIVITGDSWATVMRKAMDGSTGAAFIYFVSLFSIGNLILSNLFVAILIDHFKVATDQTIAEETDTEIPVVDARKISTVLSPGSERDLKKRRIANWDERAVVTTKLRKSEIGSPGTVRFDPEDDVLEAESSGTESEKEENKSEPDEVLAFKQFWCKGWKVSVSKKYGRPYWWRQKDDERLWVCPLGASDTLTPEEREYLQGIKFEIPRKHKKGSTVPFSSFSPYKAPPGQVKKLMSSKLDDALAFPESGFLRLFTYAATSRSLEYLAAVWKAGGQKKRVFIEHLSDAGCLCPAKDPPLLQTLISEEIKRSSVPPRNPLEVVFPTGRSNSRSSITSSYASSDREVVADYRDPLESLRHRAPKSLGLFTRDNKVRVWLARYVLHPYFDDCIILIILTNAIFLALDDYYAEERPGGRRLLEVANYVFVVIYLLEMCCKILVMGLIGTGVEAMEDGEPSNAYLTVTWNRVDAAVALSQLADLMGVPFTNKLRCARTLRILIRLESLRVVVQALLRAAPQIVYICIACGFVWIVFGILGVQLFKGEFYACNDKTIFSKEACVGTYMASAPTVLDANAMAVTPREWQNYRVNFDNIGLAALTLFEVAVVENWETTMYRAIDGGKGTNTYPYRAIYFIFFVIIGNFFCLNLFVGSLINRFNSDMETLLTRAQAKEAAYSRLLSLYSVAWVPVKPKQFIRSECYKLIFHPYFDPCILCIILLNCAVLGTERYRQSDDWTLFLNVMNYIFVVLFTLEATVKLLALGLGGYFRDAWNRFDFICVAVSVLGVSVQSVNAGAFRVMRVFRAFRLLKRARRLELLFHTLLRSLPSLGNIVLLMCYVFFNWGVVGVEMFKNLAPNDDLGRHSNFRTLPAAVLVLYQIGTTESWTDIMAGTSLTPPQCDPNIAGNCGRQWGNIVYFVSYMIIGSLISMNLFIFVVLHNFENDRLDIQEQANDSQRGELHNGFSILRENWVEACKKQAIQDRAIHTNRLDIDEFIKITEILPEPVWKRPVRVFLRTPSATKWLNLLRNIKSLPVAVPLYKPRRHNGQHQVEYSDFLTALAMRVVGLTKEDVMGHRDIRGDRAFDLVHLIGASVVQAMVGSVWCRVKSPGMVHP